MAPKGPDEGTIIECLLDRRRGFRPAGRVPFPRGKGTKRRRGNSQGRTSFAMLNSPRPPFYGSANLTGWVVEAKARVVQSTGFPSITAAAEGPVTFGCFFYRWKARLLSGWGSSSAQGNGGRVRTPAPTMYPKVYLSLRRARCPQRADSGRSGVPPLTSAACGRTVCAPTESMPSAKDRISSGKGIPRRFAAPPFDKGGFLSV